MFPASFTTTIQSRCKGLGPDDESWPADGYRGDYIQDIATAYLNGDKVDAEDQHVTASGDPEDLADIRKFAVAYLRREQDLDLKAFGVDFDIYFLESSLYESGQVEATVARLLENGHAYEHEGALWLRSTDFGDDKDRVMRKTDGGYTYFLPDVAYHLNKWQRGFVRVIDEQGADHHSTVTRVRAGLQALDEGIPEGWPEYVLHQMVTVMRNGEEVKLSKRAGSYITLRDLIDEVGRDATRYFLGARAANSQLNFDIDLALSKTNDNPVYYIQYAHARACSVMRKMAEHGWQWDASFALQQLDQLTQDSEKALLRRLDRYPEMVGKAAASAEPHAVASYLRELAGDFHSYYNAHNQRSRSPGGGQWPRPAGCLGTGVNVSHAQRLCQSAQAQYPTAKKNQFPQDCRKGRHAGPRLATVFRRAIFRRIFKFFDTSSRPGRTRDNCSRATQAPLRFLHPVAGTDHGCRC